MPIRTIKAFPHEYYHIFNRGAMKHTLFYSPEYYEIFMQCLVRYARECGITIIAYCLMPNHFHLLIRVELDGDASRFMMCLCRRFSLCANRKLKRSGTLFEGRFHMKHVDTDAYFTSLCRYIHLNPVEAGLVKHPIEYPYSSYRECMRNGEGAICESAVVLQKFGGVERYEEFVIAGIHEKKISDARLAEVLAELHVV